MSDFVNKIKTKDGTEYDIQDARMPIPEPEDDEKIVGVNVQGKYVLKPSVKEQVEGAQSGTIVDALGLNEDGELVKGAIGGGTKLYKHTVSLDAYPTIKQFTLDGNGITVEDVSPSYASKELFIISDSATPYTSPFELPVDTAIAPFGGHKKVYELSMSAGTNGYKLFARNLFVSSNSVPTDTIIIFKLDSYNATSITDTVTEL